MSSRLIAGPAIGRGRSALSACLCAAELLKLLAKFRDTSTQRADARVVVGIDLSESLELRLSGDHLACNCSGRVQHGLAFLLDVERVVLAGKLRKLIHGLIEVYLRDLEAFLEKHSFPVRGGRRQIGNERVQLINVGVFESCGALGTVIGNTDGYDTAFAVFRNRCIFVELCQRPQSAAYRRYSSNQTVVLGDLARFDFSKLRQTAPQSFLRPANLRPPIPDLRQLSPPWLPSWLSLRKIACLVA